VPQIKKASRLKFREAFYRLPIAQRNNYSRCGVRLLLRRCGWLRRRRTLLCRGLRRGSGSLGRVGLVEQANNVLSHVHRIRREDHWRSLPGAIQNYGECIIASVLAQHVDHAAADAVYDLALRFVEIILRLLRSPLERALQLFALALQPRLFVVAQRGLARAQTRLNIFHLLLHVGKLGLPGRKL
jgi:hypothetical protein